MNWWAITTIAFWICGAISSAFTGNSDGLAIALFGSVLFGLLWGLSVS